MEIWGHVTSLEELIAMPPGQRDFVVPDRDGRPTDWNAITLFGNQRGKEYIMKFRRLLVRGDNNRW